MVVASAPGRRWAILPYTIATLTQRPDVAERLPGLLSESWPTFLLHDLSGERYQELIMSRFGEFQFALVGNQGQIMALGAALPFAWNGKLRGLPDGWDAAFARAARDDRRGRKPTALSAISVTIPPEFRGQGLGSVILQSMRALGARHHLRSLVGPVRPTLKHRYPLVPLQRYLTWADEDGLLLDPWLRTHQHLGGRFGPIAPRSMVVTGTVAEWEEWTEMRFPESGTYIVPGALHPVRIDRKRDRGSYEEANIWMVHDILPEHATEVSF